MKVLVVGGAGYIGGAVTDVLLEKKIPFTVYDNLTFENHYLKPVDFLFGDVRDRKKLTKILPDYSHVIWLAALVGDGACAIRPELTREINQLAVAWLADNYSGRIIFTSTCSVYGVNTLPVNESSPTRPLSVYAQTKLQAEHYLKGKNALILRLGTAFGISDNFARLRMDLAVNYMTMNAIKYKKLTIFGGNQWRPFAHVKDIAQCIDGNLLTTQSGIYNFAPQNKTIFELAKEIKRHTHCTIEKTEDKFQDDRNYRADVKKGIKDKVFLSETKYPLAYGIEEIKEMVLSERIKDFALDRYSNEKYLLRSIELYEKGYQTN